MPSSADPFQQPCNQQLLSPKNGQGSTINTCNFCLTPITEWMGCLQSLDWGRKKLLSSWQQLRVGTSLWNQQSSRFQPTFSRDFSSVSTLLLSCPSLAFSVADSACSLEICWDVPWLSAMIWGESEVVLYSSLSIICTLYLVITKVHALGLPSFLSQGKGLG